MKRRNRDKTNHLKSALDQLHYRFIDELKTVPVASSLDENEQFLKELFKDCSDIVVRPFQMEKGRKALVVFVDGMIDTPAVEDTMRTVMVLEEAEDSLDHILQRTMPVAQINKADNYGDFLTYVLSGDTGFIIENETRGISLGIRGGEQRSVSEPDTESVVRGPREGFVENIRTNTSLLRRKIKTPHLKMKPFIIGRESNTNIVVSYLEDIADPALVEEVVKRIQKIEIDAVLESGYIEEFIQDSYLSPFPQVQYTERPDTVAFALLQGRIAIFVDGTPMVLVVPFVFWEMLHANEDYYERFHISTLIRWLRHTFFLLSLLTPALYIAVTTYHQDLLPTTLLLSMAAARESIPFPAIVEALIMEITFEALREAGIRLPKAVGSAVSILGALVVGQAAVEAGIVSAPVVIVVSITGIASFTIPRFNGAIAIRMLRFPLMIAASIFGIFGILVCILIIVGHLANLRSFGIPYLSPIGPLSIRDLRNTLVRAPWPVLNMRPSYFSVQDEERIGKEIQAEIISQEGQKGTQIHHEQPSKGE